MNPIIAKLQNDCCQYRQINSFSDKPGIYALFFTGNNFPLGSYTPKKDEIIYIGKTESSQSSRDEKTHFASGKTGSSTLRRSLGALLKKELSLTAIPRNDNDFDAGRKSFFRFDDPSEEKLTTWMKDNLALSFYEYDQSQVEINLLEAALIGEVRPLLNIDSKNPENPFARIIKASRKSCADEANQIVVTEEPLPVEKKTKVVPFRPAKPEANAHKYEEIFKNALPQIEQLIDDAGPRKLSTQLSKEAFKKVANRPSFSFTVEFSDGVVVNDITASAVARDLAWVFEQDARISGKLKGKHLKFNMDKGFTLWVSNK